MINDDQNPTDVVVTSGVGGENRKIKIVILIASIGMLLFIGITLTFSFHEPVFRALFPKPPSLALVTSPIPSPTPEILTPAPLPSVKAQASSAPTSTINFAGAKRVFLTSTLYDGKLGGLSGADLKCQLKADSLNLGGSFKAWLSDSKTAASSRLTNWNGPYKTMDGIEIAENWTDLTDGVLKAPINIDEFGYKISWDAWTNTDEKGESLGSEDCIGWTSNISYIGKVGSSSFVDLRWTNNSSSTCNYTRRLYCLEQ
jgi:hypothetical protein